MFSTYSKSKLDKLIGAILVILMALMVAYTAFLIVQSRRQTQEAVAELTAELPQSAAWDRHWAVQVALVVAGLVLLVLGSDWLVTAAVAFARSLGVSDLVIGLTIVAAGTSMPEVATSVMAAVERNLKGSDARNVEPGPTAFW